MNNEATIDAKCTIDPNCQSRESVAHDADAGEFACAEHASAIVTAPVRKLVSMTGRRVHLPATPDQQTTYQTRCAPGGRMGVRQMRLRFTTDERYAVDCKGCLR